MVQDIFTPQTYTPRGSKMHEKVDEIRFGVASPSNS